MLYLCCLFSLFVVEKKKVNVELAPKRSNPFFILLFSMTRTRLILSSISDQNSPSMLGKRKRGLDDENENRFSSSSSIDQETGLDCPGRAIKSTRRDEDAIKARTLEKMQQMSFRQQEELRKPLNFPPSFTNEKIAEAFLQAFGRKECYVCRKKAKSIECYYCTRTSCLDCFRQCVSCKELFCCLCAAPSYRRDVPTKDDEGVCISCLRS